MPRQRRRREGRPHPEKREKRNLTGTRVTQAEADPDYAESDDAASLCNMTSSRRRESRRRTNATPVRHRRSRKRPSAAIGANKAMTSDIVSEPGSAQDSANFNLGVDTEEVGSESDSEGNKMNTEKKSEEDEVQTDTDNGINSDNVDNISEYRQALRKKFKLDVYPAKADGNCLFRSVAQQVFHV